MQNFVQELLKKQQNILQTKSLEHESSTAAAQEAAKVAQEKYEKLEQSYTELDDKFHDTERRLEQVRLFCFYMSVVSVLI